MNKKFEIIEKIQNATIIHHVDEKYGLWATHGRKIIFRTEDGFWQSIAEFPFSFPRDIFGFSRLSARAMRSDKCNLFVNRFGNILGIRSGVAFRIEKEKAIPLFAIQGDCVLHRSICEDTEGNIYFGEYFMNPGRHPVNIWQVSADLRQWQKLHQFTEIRHVHGVYRDPFNKKAFWITVGDFKGECFLMKTEDCFGSFIRIGDGSQTWRAVNIFFTPEYISWLTDSNLEINHACRWMRRNRKLEVGQSLDSSSWYGCTTHEGYHLAFTTIEQGPAILSNESSVLISEDAFHWEKIFSFKKDPWKPVQVFKYGVISCPSGSMSNNSIYLSGEGLIGLDGISIKARIF